jgi:histidine triad (HIT) family protein
MADTIFTKIIKGEIPAHKVYEDEKTFAFLDIHPAKPGHTLVVTKAQIDKFTDLPDEDYIALWRTVKKISSRLLEVLKTDRVKVSIVGTDVPHVHVHLIPFDEHNKDTSQDMNAEPDNTALAEMAKKLAF